MQLSVGVIALLVVIASCQEELGKNPNSMYASSVTSYSTRLHPNQDIMTQLIARTKKYHLKAASIISAVGSVLHCSLRFANNSYLTRVEGPMEIVSLSGTIDQNQKPHIHISLANGNGVTVGGHLPSLKERQTPANHDCPIFTTLELVFAQHTNIRYIRQKDPETTFDQLTIAHRGAFTISSSQL